MGTLVGVFITYTLPDGLASLMGRAMNDAFYERQTALISVGAAVANWVMTSYYR